MPERSTMSTGLDPFVDGRGENYYFVTPALRQRIDLVRHLIEFGRQIIMLTGPPGAGKSALLERVTEPLDKKWRVLRFTAGPTLNRSALLGKIADELATNGSVDNDEALIAEIRKHLKALSQKGETTVLAIDDAHALPVDTPSCLAALSRAVDNTTEIRVVLSGDPGQSPLVDQLQSEVSQSALVHVVEIPRLSEEQTASMLTHRWKAAYGNNEIPVTAADLSQIYRQSNGNAGKALVLARQAQVLAGNSQRSLPDPARRYLIGGVVALIVFILFAFLNAGDSDGEPQTEVEIRLPAATLSGGRRQPPAPALSEPSREPPAAAAEEEQETTGVAEQSHTPESTSVAAIRTEAPLPPDDGAPPETPAAAAPSAAATEATPQQPEPAAAPKESAEPPITQQVKAKPPEAKQTTLERYSIAWLRTQAAEGYVLQLFGVRDRHAAVKFIEQRKIGSKSTVLVTNHKGAPWYVVVYGNYPNRAAAMAAIPALPGNLAGTKPWARPIASLE
ncbi:MAG TPA: AAA family ATPase [Gammaproteobacteria bacterium]|nr:AAA family ATPase [Gammaproteobacteria bacterium]